MVHENQEAPAGLWAPPMAAPTRTVDQKPETSSRMLMPQSMTRNPEHDDDDDKPRPPRLPSPCAAGKAVVALVALESKFWLLRLERRRRRCTGGEEKEKKRRGNTNAMKGMATPPVIVKTISRCGISTAMIKTMARRTARAAATARRGPFVPRRCARAERPRRLPSHGEATGWARPRPRRRRPSGGRHPDEPPTARRRLA